MYGGTTTLQDRRETNGFMNGRHDTYQCSVLPCPCTCIRINAIRSGTILGINSLCDVISSNSKNILISLHCHCFFVYAGEFDETIDLRLEEE